MKASHSYAAVAVLSATAAAVVLPEPTGASDFSLEGFSPKPTLAPVGIHELLRRQDETTTDETVLVAPDNTCGFISGRPGAGYTCGVEATCVFFTSKPARMGAIACCNEIECNARISCVNSVDYFSSSACGDGCEVDAFTLKCTESSAPYCNTITFTEGIRDYWCNNLDITTAQTASTTYRGQEGDRSFQPLALTGGGSTTARLSIESTGTVVDGPSITGDPSGPVTVTATGSPKKDDDGAPVGAIVGGVVGGVGGLGLIGLAAFFLIRRKKKNAAATTDAAAVPPPYQQPPMQQQPGTGPGGYNAVPQQNTQTYYDPKHPYPSPNSQYVQPNSAVTPGGFFPDPNATTPSSPTVTDPRMSQMATSPTPSYATYNNQQPPHQGFQPQEQVIHEAPANPQDSHRGQMHELA